MTRRVVVIQKQGPDFRPTFKVNLEDWEQDHREPEWLSFFARVLFWALIFLIVANILNQFIHAWR